MTYIQREYFDWLCQIVRTDEQTLYWYDVLYALNASEFVVRHPKDSNRVEDARDLRSDFRAIYGPSRGILAIERAPVSILEVLVALARRGETEIMHDPELGDRTPQWFWTMIYNLGLDEFAYRGALDNAENDLKFMKIIENFVKRRYSVDGNGNVFKNKTGHFDPRREELWNQMCYYFDGFF